MKVSSPFFRNVSIVTCGLLVFQQVVCAPLLFAQDGLGAAPPILPAGGNVVAGSANIQQAGANLNVQSHTDRAIINWNNFSVANGNAVNFNQPGVNSAVLNRVITANPSAIHGAINSNGNVYLVNPNGILVGPTGVINTGGFTASTFDIANSDFMNGNFNFAGDSTAGIVNQGTIQTGAGGVNLMANQIVNNGLIESAGNINLITGGTVQLKNGGSYTQADQGTVQSGISETAGLIQNTGTIRATGALEVGGEVYLVNPNGKVLQQGLIAAAKNDVGGKVVATGSDVELNNATIDVSGDHGGGDAYVGGGFQGNNDAILNAATTTVDDNSSISADALVSGDGGTVVIWSDESTSFAGTINARGGQQSGDGGLVEVSGASLSMGGIVDTSAISGASGWLLLDPIAIEVIDSDMRTLTLSSSNPSMTVTDAWLSTALGQGNVVLATSPEQVAYQDNAFNFPGYPNLPNDENIIFNAGTAVDTGANTLFLSSKSVDLFSTITGNVKGGLSSPLTPAGFTLQDPTTINVHSGGLIQNAMDVIGSGGTVNVGAGTFDSFVAHQSDLMITGVGASTIVQTSSPAITVNANGTSIMNMNLVGTGAAGDIGILLDGVAAPNLTGISIQNVAIDNMEDGIVAQGTVGTGLATDVLIDGVTITNAFNDGIRFSSTDTAVVEILSSNIGSSGSRVGGHGINLEGLTGSTAGFTLDGNVVFAAGKAVNALNLSGGAVLDIAGGSYDGVNGGLLVRNSSSSLFVPPPQGKLKLSDSTFVGGAGSSVVDLSHDPSSFIPPIFLFARPGIDVTVSPNVVISGGATGLTLSGQRLNIVGNTLSDLAFLGQTGDYIELGSLAELTPGVPNLIDANSVTFDGMLPGDMDASQLIALENKIEHFRDNFGTGFIDFGAVVVHPFTSIQLGVNFAGANGIGRVVVPNGIYGGSVEIWVDGLEVLGESPLAIINTNTVDPFANNGDRDNGFEIADFSGVGPGGDVSGVTIDGFSFGSLTLGPANTGVVLGHQSSTATDTTVENSLFANLNEGIRGRFVDGTTTISRVGIATGNHGIRFANNLNNVTIDINNAAITSGGNGIRFGGQVNDSQIMISDVRINNDNFLVTGEDAILFRAQVNDSQVSIMNSNLTALEEAIDFRRAINGSSVTISGSDLTSNGGDAILFRRPINDSTVLIGGPNSADSNVILGDDDGINIDEIVGSSFIVENNASIVGRGGSGIEFDDTISRGSSIRIVGNQLISGGEEAIEFDTNIRGSQVRIARNSRISGGLDAIQFKDSIALSHVRIANNRSITSAGGDGISFEDSITRAGILMLNNSIASASGDGVAFQDEIRRSAIGIVGNRVRSFGEAIQFFDDINHSWIGVIRNITASNGSGIAFSDRGAADPVIDNSRVIVAGNTIDGPLANPLATPDFGIQFEGIDGSSRVIVTNNNVIKAGEDGLLVQDFVSGNALLNISNNTFGSATRRMGGNGIDIDLVDSTRGIQIVGNTVFSANNAIEFDDDLVNTVVSIAGNRLNALNRDGIQIEDAILGTTQLTVLNNEITAGRHGIGQLVNSSIQGDAVVRIENNSIESMGSLGTGILLRNVGSSAAVLVNQNTIANGRFGLQVIQSDATGLDGQVILENLLIQSPMRAGIRIINQNAVDSVEVTMFNNVVIDGGDITQTGLFFSGENLTLTGDTLGNLQFVRMPGDFIVLQDGALFQPGTPTLIDATGVDFDGIDTNTIAGFNEVESRVFHFIDDPTLGLFWPGFQLPDNLTYDRFGRARDLFETRHLLFGIGNEGSINYGEGQNPPNPTEPLEDGTIPEQRTNSYDLFGSAN